MYSRESAFPRWLQIEVTTACNLKCSYCDHSWESIPKRHFPLTLSDNCFAGLLGLDAVLLQGFGEPMLYKDMIALILEIKRHHTRVSIQTVTNGMINSERVREIVQNIDILYVSIDSLSNEYWQNVRVGGDLDTIKDNVANFCRINENLKIIVNCVVSRLNLEELNNLVYFCVERKYFGLSLIPLFSSGNGIATDQHSLSDIWQYMCEHAKTLEKICSNNSLELYHPFNPVPQKNCLWPTGGLYVLADGTVTPCCVMSSPFDEAFGSLHNSSLKDILGNSTRLIEFEETYKSHILCKKCMKQNFHEIWNRFRPLPLISP